MLPSEYPHKLSLIPSGDPYQDSNGNWVNPVGGAWSDATSLAGDCRDQPVDKGPSKLVIDGKVVEYGSIIYCDLAIPDLKRGDQVRVSQGGKVRLEGDVKRFSRDYFHCRIWV